MTLAGSVYVCMGLSFRLCVALIKWTVLHQAESDTEAPVLRACPDRDAPAEAHALAAAPALTAGSWQLWSRTAHAGSTTRD